MPGAGVFAKLPAQADFVAMEHEILGLWDELDAFAESNRRRADSEPFVFYDGPPFATGRPHYGHLLAGTIKDIVPRFWCMRGRRVERRFGWDCHGLPIEALAQDAMGLAGTGEILEGGVDVFNEQCRSMVQTYVDEWRRTVTRMGRWVDFDNDYKTMDPAFMESVWWVFKQLWDQGRVYRSHRIMPYSWKLTTPLSNFEANSNYKDVQDPAITLRFPVTMGAADHGLDGPVSILAWTTTPWTLPENLALCVGGDIEYLAVRHEGETLVVAADRAETVFGRPRDELDVAASLAGRELAGWRYRPLFPYWAEHPGAFVVLVDDFVSTGDGTGIVHLAPAYGEDDYRVCSAAGIDLVDGLDAEARFLPEVADFAGQHAKEADKAIIRALKDRGLLFHQSTVVHSYPFCERTDTPLIYRAIEAWYVRVEDLRERMVELNQAIGWVPESVGAGRFGKWLENARDWNISRNRFWGSCIPVWINEDDPEDMICVGSVTELEELSGVRVSDLHKHHVDEILVHRDGKTYRRTPEVLDCWFESGSMPYAQHHFPFADGAALEDFFPADFIAEGLDQTRGWFYTLLILGTALFDRSPYRNVVVNGMILAEDGQKMSKRKQNYPAPDAVLEEYGADALRAYLINSPVVRGEPLRFSEKGLEDIVKMVVLRYWNALSFFTTYASVDAFDPREWPARSVAERPDADRWVLSVLQSLIRDVTYEMEAYRLYNVVPRLVGFIDDLTNWYIRISRRRFWKSEDRRDQGDAYHTLYAVLTTFARVLAPFMPFLTETVYQQLVRPIEAAAPASVHWCDYPAPEGSLIDTELEQRMATARRTVELGRKLREEHRLRIRQPLSRLTVVHRDPSVRAATEAAASIIADELNVKAVAVEADESAFCSISVKPNFQTLRARCPQKIGPIAKELKDWGFAEVGRLESGATVSAADEPLTLDDVLLQRQAVAGAAVATDGEITAVLDTELDPDLVREGLAREFTSLLQNARKRAGLDVSDRIVVRWDSTSAEVAAALERHAESVAEEVLATAFERDATAAEEAELTGEPVRYAIAKA